MSNQNRKKKGGKSAGGKPGVFLKRSLNVVQVGDVTLLEAVATPAGEGRLVQAFFRHGTPAAPLRAGRDLDVIEMRAIGNAPVLRAMVADSRGKVRFSLAGAQFALDPMAPETGLFAGMNVVFGVRNGETAAITLDWLRYHVRHHGLQGALILDRARPGSDAAYEKALRAGVARIEGLERVVLLECAVPLGQDGLPAEAHPCNVPGAPGKDRMEIPAADPWTAPLGNMQIYELARARFLGEARAVANIDPFDLIPPAPDGSIFDRACAAAEGCIRLAGVQCYPWRVRVGDATHFADHICVQFDAKGTRNRWCVAPQKLGRNSVWRLIRVVGANPGPRETAVFHRHMALRHPTDSVSKIVPKTSLIEDAAILARATGEFGHKPVRMPEETLAKSTGKARRTAIVTTMKNEGPFILEWIAYHRAIGVSDFLVYTNDCTDGTDSMLKLLQKKGIVQHRENPFKGTGLKPQHAALQAAENEDLVKRADWLICMDVDEFISIHTGKGRLEDLFRAVPEANMISLTWRLFGNNDIHEYSDSLICENFTRCADKMARKPHQAWGFKTLFANIGLFKKLGVHRPKGLKPQLWEKIRWANGSGQAMPSSMFRNGWRSTTRTVGYDLVTLNHYALRSAESFLVKRDRGRVNHVDRDQGLSYWFRMNNNARENRDIHRMLPALKAELAQLMADPEIAAAHEFSVARHREKIAELRAREDYAAFYALLTSPRLERMSRMHLRFGANVFLAGPDCVPDEIVARDPDEDFLFTVERTQTTH